MGSDTHRAEAHDEGIEPAGDPGADLARATALDGGLHDLAELAAQACEVPIAFVTTVPGRREGGEETIHGAVGTPRTHLAVEGSLTARLDAAASLTLIGDTKRSPRWTTHPLVVEDGIRWLALAPLRHGSSVGGVLCVLDTRPRHLSDTQRECLILLARQASELLLLHRDVDTLRHDVERRARESSEVSAFLLAMSTELAGIADPQDLMCRAMYKLCARLPVARVTLAEIDHDRREAVLMRQSADVDETLEIVSVPLARIGDLEAQLARGRPWIVRDTRRDSSTADQYEDFYGPETVGALIAVPLMRGGAVVALLTAVSDAPRDWRNTDIELVQRVADIVWPAFEKARADQSLSVSEARLRLAQSIASIGTWEWDASTDQCYLSPECCDLFGLTAGQPQHLDAILHGVDPRDLSDVRAAIDRCQREGAVEMEFRYVHRTRGPRWVHSRAGMVSYAGRPCMVGISIDITSRKHGEQALHELNQRKDEFLAMLAHELRNPLAPIRSAAQILRAYAREKPELEWALAVIERQARHLTRLVGDLLDVSRIVRGQIGIERREIDLGEAVRHAIETSRPAIRARRHQLEVLVPRMPVKVDGDLTRLAQVISNLLINAANYTAEGGHIRIETRTEDDRAVVTVSDSGIGISSEFLPHVFELFTQAQRTPDRALGGLGVGLTLVKRIVEMHEGTVEARSAGEGRGSEFTVRLPLARASASEIGAETPRSVPRSASPSRRILVVDDNVDAAESIAMLLGLDGHEVRSAHGAQAALDTAAAFRPEVVLLDIGLPGMDGYEVARRLRSGANAIERLRLIALTGYGQQEDRERTRAAGFDEHLVKPVEPETLAQILSALR